MPKTLVIPEHLLAYVFDYLPAKTIVTVLRQVCKAWAACIEAWLNAKCHPMRRLVDAWGLYYLGAEVSLFDSRARHEFDVVHFDCASLTESVASDLRAEPSLALLSTEEIDRLCRTTEALQGYLARSHAVTALYNRVLYRFGGRLLLPSHSDSVERLKSGFKIDICRRTASPLPQMLLRRSAPSFAVALNRLYVVGGFDGNHELGSMEVFDLPSEAWLEYDDVVSSLSLSPSTATPAAAEASVSASRLWTMPFAICEAATVCVANRFVVIAGGCQRRDQPDEFATPSVHYYDALFGTWGTLEPLPKGRILGALLLEPETRPTEVSNRRWNASKGTQLVALQYFGGCHIVNGRTELGHPSYGAVVEVDMNSGTLRMATSWTVTPFHNAPPDLHLDNPTLRTADPQCLMNPVVVYDDDRILVHASEYTFCLREGRWVYDEEESESRQSFLQVAFAFE